MKYLKNVLLAASLVVTTMGMSLSANAALIQQDIFLDVDVAAGDSLFDDVGHGLTDTLDQLLGSIMYNTDDANGLGEIAAADTSIVFSIGGVTLTEADLLFGGSDPILLAANAEVDGILNMTLEFEFLLNGFDIAITAIADTDFGGLFLLDDPFGLAVSGETRLGQVNQVAVSEPSALILMLAGFGFLVRRKIAAK
jgi:hypothetical protein